MVELFAGDNVNPEPEVELDEDDAFEEELDLLDDEEEATLDDELFEDELDVATDEELFDEEELLTDEVEELTADDEEPDAELTSPVTSILSKFTPSVVVALAVILNFMVPAGKVTLLDAELHVVHAPVPKLLLPPASEPFAVTLYETLEPLPFA